MYLKGDSVLPELCKESLNSSRFCRSNLIKFYKMLLPMRIAGLLVFITGLFSSFKDILATRLLLLIWVG